MRDPFLKGSKFTIARAKDKVRSRVAFNRQRVNGLFVSKQKEEQLARAANGGGYFSDDESETLCHTNE